MKKKLKSKMKKKLILMIIPIMFIIGFIIVSLFFLNKYINRTAQSYDETQLQKYEKNQQLHGEKNIGKYQEMLKVPPEKTQHINILFSLAGAYKKTKNYESAIKIYQKIINEYQDYEKIMHAYEYMADCYHQLGNYYKEKEMMRFFREKERIKNVVLSPFEDKLIYVKESLNGPSKLWLIDLKNNENKPLYYMGFFNSGISWSPNGEIIVFSIADTSQLNPDWGVQKSDIFSLNIKNNELKLLTNKKYSSRFPVWSPDGKKIAYGGTEEAGNAIYSLQIMNADGTHKKDLTNPMGDDDYPLLFTKSGESIVYEVAKEATCEICMIDIDGKNNKFLPGGPGFQISPDNKKIAYYKYEEDHYDVCIFDIETLRERQLTNDNFNREMISWASENEILYKEWDRDTNEDAKIDEYDVPSFKLYNLTTSKIKEIKNIKNMNSIKKIIKVNKMNKTIIVRKYDIEILDGLDLVKIK